MTTVTMTDDGLATLARRLVTAYRTWAHAKRPIDQKVTEAYVDGMCEAVHAFGLGMTPFAIRLAVKTAYDASECRRPRLMVTGDNAVLKAYDAAVAKTLAASLADL
jgi:hypothetical protein